MMFPKPGPYKKKGSKSPASRSFQAKPKIVYDNITLEEADALCDWILHVARPDWEDVAATDPSLHSGLGKLFKLAGVPMPEKD